MNFDDFDLEIQCDEYYSEDLAEELDEKEYIIENITQKEWEILEDNEIDWCPDCMFEMQHDGIIFREDEYNKAMKLLGR